MNNKKGLFIALLVITSLFLSSLTYAYWAKSANGANTSGNGTVVIGEGNDVVTSVSVSDQVGEGALVPVGFADEVQGYVESITLSYEVVWTGATDDANGIASVLNVSVNNVLIGGDATYASLVNVSINNPGSIVLGGTQTVTITVTLTEPANQTAYNAIVNQDITFNVSFSVNQVNS